MIYKELQWNIEGITNILDYQYWSLKDQWYDKELQGNIEGITNKLDYYGRSCVVNVYCYKIYANCSKIIF